jgi:hypothetical protein
MTDLAQVIDLAILLLGGILLIKRVAEMDRYHAVRVVVLTSILGSVVVYFFLVYGFTLGNPIQYDCLEFDANYCHYQY